MKRTLLVAALFAVALAACSKKEDLATALPAPATPPALPAAAPEAPALPAAAPAETPAPADAKPAN